MSLSSADLLDLLDQWEELKDLNLSIHNLTWVDATVCSGAVGHAGLLRVLCVLYVFIFLVGTTSNALVVWVTLRSDRKCADLFVLQLAAADLVAVATLPVSVSSLLRAGRWPFGEALCKLTHLVFSVNLFSSILFLACMSLDWYLSATRPPGGHSREPLRRLVCAAVWLLALAAAVPETYFLQAVASVHHDGAVCRPVFPSREMMVGVQLSFTVLGFLIPFPVIAASYLALAAALPPGSDPARGVSRRVVLSYTVVFVVCWLPLHVVLLLDLAAPVLPFSCRLEDFLWVALQVSQCLSMLHCCLNPVLYGLHRTYRYHLMKAFIFRYSTRSGVARLIETESASETDVSAADRDQI
ncbi:hypothetical protein PBY51_016545 [Eleginops maclovinus]|uniref:G-protein coupled receptors family 1 profile domain-containing protein n=1 Tax=Eleginops maclovinus TaxID=56733 RepID=A0AAN7WRA7_ELEMC|nr:hypothetical protein PBY51_016545 [Eleginops maclovinus]